jgi:carboxypeptidase family protein
MKKQLEPLHYLVPMILFVFICLTPAGSVHAQDYVTGSFEGEVKDSVTGSSIAGATVRITNQETGVPVAKQTDAAGRFRQGLLPPGDYTITILKQGYVTQTLQRSLPALRPTVVLPPVPLVPESAPAPTSTPAAGPTPVATTEPTTPQPTTQAPAPKENEDVGIREEINTIDARRGGTYVEKEVSSLPLGGATFTRTFDELGLLLPGVAPPPQTLGSVAGPGVGAGVGSAGQFSVNGMRSRANNFTVDGSDNNDEDIGVRRQGFLALVPQPIESIKEFQMITLLAPAQYGRNVGAQVNAISKSGGNDTHGSLFGLLNSSQLNSRNFFDTTNGNAVTQLRSGSQPVLLDGAPLRIRNQSGGDDSFTLGQGGLVLGGPLSPNKMFYFISAEGDILNATQEASFAVPTVAQRGLLGTGATGIFTTPAPDVNGVFPVGSPNFFFPTTVGADAIFSLFPFPNNPNGVYGANTFTQVLPASGQGRILSGKFDGNFKLNERQQSLTARYNFTQDWRDIAVTGGAIFSSLRPRVRTQNFSTFLNSELSGPDATRPVFNQLRLSYGRTRLSFQELRDNTFQVPSDLLPNEPFLLNAPEILNVTLPNVTQVVPVIISGPNTGPVRYISSGINSEDRLGPVGQVNIAGFSPVGVDVFNFPQRRVNNTYQLADTVTLSTGSHSFAFGTDIRRTELNSDLPRNSRPLITFAGAPRLDFDLVQGNPTNFRFSNNFIPGIDLAAASASSGFVQTLATTDSAINLRYYQLNFFGQDEWRMRPNFSLSYGLRYEYNTPPRELNDRIESTFDSPSLSLVPGLSPFVNGRTSIFDPDRNNFAPRVGFAYSPKLFEDKVTVIRGGYGLFYDQILGSVVSQSRNVFPNFLTVNFSGGGFGTQFGRLGLLNPNIFAQPGTLNRVFPGLTTAQLVTLINLFATGNVNPATSVFGATLPARNLDSPMAHQYGVTVEQQLNRNLIFSAAYVGTLGRNLLRFTTPNLGPNDFTLPLAIDALSIQPELFGFALPPGTRLSATGNLIGGRPISGVGVINRFESTAESRYDALQVQLRGRYNFLGATQFQVNYTFGSAKDDVSDVFDLAGAPALPQNSLTFAGEHGPANFDVRHRVSSNYISDLSSWGKSNSFLHAIFNGLEVAGTGSFQTGQPFTVNSIFDVNLDGNLTDRPNTTNGIVQTNDRSQPLRLTVNPVTLLAPVGQDGQVPRNTFRASNLWLTNAALIKTISFSESKKLVFRAEAFNLFNRSNFGIPVRFLEFPSFGKATDTVTPGRRIQFGLKLAF